MTRQDDFASWDGAYVLGALAPAERHAYEEHLRECAACTASVAELAGIPGLLGRVAPEEGFALLAEGQDDPAAGERPDALPVLLAEARRRRVRTRWMAAAGLAVAAAVLAVLAFVLPAALAPAASPPVASVTMTQVQPSPLTASARIVPEPWGTRIELNCRYGYAADGGADSDRAWSYVLVVTDASGRETPLSTWTAAAGSTVAPTATVAVPPSQIRSLEVRTADAGTVLLRTTFG